MRGLRHDAYYRVRGIDSIKNVPGSDSQAYLAANQYRFREVWKDNETGDVLFRWWGKYRIVEYAAKRVKKSHVPADLIPPEGLTGPIYAFKVWDRIRDSFKDAEGNVLFRSRALTFYRQLFDTLGDHAPGGTTLDVTIVKQYGHDPLTDASPCDYLPDPS